MAAFSQRSLKKSVSKSWVADTYDLHPSDIYLTAAQKCKNVSAKMEITSIKYIYEKTRRLIKYSQMIKL